MKRIGNYDAVAPKLSGNGQITYRLWVNGDGILFLELVDNENEGTFSDLLFPVSEYAHLRNDDAALGELRGFNRASGELEPAKDNNNGAFVKAVLQDLLPD